MSDDDLPTSSKGQIYPADQARDRGGENDRDHSGNGSGKDHNGKSTGRNGNDKDHSEKGRDHSGRDRDRSGRGRDHSERSMGHNVSRSETGMGRGSEDGSGHQQL